MGELIVVAAAVLLASMVQVVAGFGLALLAVPVMTLAISTRDAVVITTLMSMSMTTFQAWHERAERHRQLAWRLAIAAYAGMPLGFVAFVLVDERVLQLALGVSVLVAVVVLAARVNLERGGLGLDLACGFTAGVLNTSISTSGPPLVFALQAQHLSGARFRATISWVFAVSNVLAITLFVAGGKVTSAGVSGAAVAVPALIAGQVLGFPLRRHVHGERFRWLVLVLLAVAAVSAMTAAITA